MKQRVFFFLKARARVCVCVYSRYIEKLGISFVLDFLSPLKNIAGNKVSNKKNEKSVNTTVGKIVRLEAC